MHDVFYLFLQGQKIIKKRWIDKKIVEQLKFETGRNNKEYKIESICNNAVYTRKSETGYLLGLYYLIS